MASGDLSHGQIWYEIGLRIWLPKGNGSSTLPVRTNERLRDLLPGKQSQSEVVREGLRLLKEREELKKLRLAGLRKEIAIGSEQAGRGEFVN